MAELLQDIFLTYAHNIRDGQAKDRYIYCLEENKFYIYEAGVWRQIYDMEFLAKISQYIKDITKFPLSQRKQIIENYKIVAHQSLRDFNYLPLLNLKNYMVDIKGDNILSHHPDYYSTIQLPYIYDINAKCDLWLKTLHEIFEGDTKRIELLQEFFGYCLTYDVEQKKALLLLGESDTGKSTVLFTLRDLVGQPNCSSVPLKYLSNPQYTPMMVNKLVNIDADVAKDASNYEAEFKIITSGEPISCNQKFIETFEFIPKCKIVLAANIFPKITDHSSAFYKRLILIPCDRIFDEKEKNRFLNLQLKDELPGIWNWAMAGLRRLKKRGMFEQHDFMKNAVQELEDENNPVNSFFEEHIEIAFEQYIEKAELYEKYKEWTYITKNYTLSKERFAACVYQKFHKETPNQARSSSDSRSYIWKNIKYVHFKDDNKHEIDFREPAAVNNSSNVKAVNPLESRTGSQEDIQWD